MSNALKFSHKNTRILVSLKVNVKDCVISIKDQGLGIKSEDISKLFMPFAQLSNLPTGNEKSTGLGLSIVKNLVELLGGTISVASIPNEGTTFTLRLPRQKKQT